MATVPPAVSTVWAAWVHPPAIQAISNTLERSDMCLSPSPPAGFLIPQKVVGKLQEPWPYYAGRQGVRLTPLPAHWRITSPSGSRRVRRQNAPSHRAARRVASDQWQ